MEDEDEILKKRIAALSTRISQAKAETGGTPYSYQYPDIARNAYGTNDAQPYRLAHRLILHIKDYPRHTWQPQRGTPYGAPYRGRGGYARKPVVPHRNKTLILNNATEPANGSDEAAAGWVSKTDRHMQLINNSVYEQKAHEKVQAMEETRRYKQVERAQQEMAKVVSLKASVITKGSNAGHFITIEGVRFLVADGGNKLVKIKDGLNENLVTPKRAEISGVSFFRSKHGNLYRAGLVKTQRQKAGIAKVQKPCLLFSTTGTCPKGPNCRYVHDPHKVAMCKEYLQKGECRYGEHCNLSHEPTAERVPACLHFLRGSCTNDHCRYAHVRVNPGAPVCKAFATYGFCTTGIDCEQRHVHECPDYANKGFCRKATCHLPHVDRASQLRKVAAIGSSDEENGPDFSSDEDGDSDDYDSEGYEYLRGGANSHDLSQQSDFVML